MVWINLSLLTSSHLRGPLNTGWGREENSIGVQIWRVYVFFSQLLWPDPWLKQPKKKEATLAYVPGGHSSSWHRRHSDRTSGQRVTLHPQLRSEEGTMELGCKSPIPAPTNLYPKGSETFKACHHVEKGKETKPRVWVTCVNEVRKK